MWFSVYCLSFCFEFEESQNTQNKSSEKHLYKRKFVIQLIFNLGLVSILFQTTCPCFQQANLRGACDPIENQHLVSGEVQFEKACDPDELWTWTVI